MAEPEVATKAAENDMQEDTDRTGASSSLIPGDSTAQSGPSMGEHCTTDRPSPNESPRGEMANFDATDVYISKPPNYPSSPSKLLLLLTGGTGIHSKNNQLQADRFAAEGYVVVMPDQFAGDPAPSSTASMPALEDEPSLLEQVKLRAAETAKSFMIDMWLARHGQEKVMPIILKVLDSAKNEFADAVANGGGIYAVGYCFGAKYVLLLAGEHSDTVMPEKGGKDEENGIVQVGPLIKAGAVAHATLVTRQDMLAIKAPVSMVCVGKRANICARCSVFSNPEAENDPLFPEDILEVGRQHLESSKTEHEIKTYQRVPHGKASIIQRQIRRLTYLN